MAAPRASDDPLRPDAWRHAGRVVLASGGFLAAMVAFANLAESLSGRHEARLAVLLAETACSAALGALVWFCLREVRLDVARGSVARDDVLRALAQAYFEPPSERAEVMICRASWRAVGTLRIAISPTTVTVVGPWQSARRVARLLHEVRGVQ